MPILPLSLKSADPVCIIKLFNSFVILGGLINAPAGLVRAISLNSIKISRFSSKNASEGNSEANSAYKHKSVPALGLKRFIFLRI